MNLTFGPAEPQTNEWSETCEARCAVYVNGVQVGHLERHLFSAAAVWRIAGDIDLPLAYAVAAEPIPESKSYRFVSNGQQFQMVGYMDACAATESGTLMEFVLEQAELAMKAGR